MTVMTVKIQPAIEKNGNIPGITTFTTNLRKEDNPLEVFIQTQMNNFSNAHPIGTFLSIQIENRNKVILFAEKRF
jgi:hypothetical protein